MIGYYVAEAAVARHDALVEEAAERRRARLSGRPHRFVAFWRRGWLSAPSVLAPRYQESGYRSARALNGSYGPAGTPNRYVPKDAPVLEPYRSELPERLAPLPREAELPAPLPREAELPAPAGC